MYQIRIEPYNKSIRLMWFFRRMRHKNLSSVFNILWPNGVMHWNSYCDFMLFLFFCCIVTAETIWSIKLWHFWHQMESLGNINLLLYLYCVRDVVKCFEWLDGWIAFNDVSINDFFLYQKLQKYYKCHSILKNSIPVGIGFSLITRPLFLFPNATLHTHVIPSTKITIATTLIRNRLNATIAIYLMRLKLKF